MNGHLNNTRYADILCDALPWSVWEQGTVQDLLLFYHREVPRGESFTLSRARTGEKQYYFNGEREGKSASRGISGNHDLFRIVFFFI